MGIIINLEFLIILNNNIFVLEFKMSQY